MTARVVVERWLPAPGVAPAWRDVALEISGDCVVASPGKGAGSGLLALHAPINAHDHGYGIRPFDFGCIDDALEPWIAFMRVRPPTDPYLEALVAFGRLALSGCGATMHCHNSLNADRLVEEAVAVARAAAECGIRLALSCPLLDDSPFVYGGLPEVVQSLDEPDRKRLMALTPKYLPIGEQIAQVEEIARAIGGTGIDVQYGPIGPQWASNALLEAIADASATSGRRIHMHLLESPRQRAWLDQRFPEGIVTYLDRIGFLSGRLAVAHGVQLKQDECELLADRGVTLVSNPSANLRLRSGIAPLDAVRKAGLHYAIGLDGTGFDDDQDVWREMRLLSLLHGGQDIEPRIAAADVFAAAQGRGAVVLNQPADQDVVVVDYASLTKEALFDDLDEAAILLGRMSAKHVRDLHVAGRHVVANGRIATFDYDAARNELAQQARCALPDLHRRRADARFVSQIVRRHYGAGAA